MAYRGPRLLRPQSRRREDTPRSDAILKRRLSDIVYHQMITDAPARGNGPGRTPGGGYWLQRGRLAPRRWRFGEVTSRTRKSLPGPGSHFPDPEVTSRTRHRRLYAR
jgi:hypothetical protein